VKRIADRIFIIASLGSSVLRIGYDRRHLAN
jgi:hypothetical protein